MDSDYVQKVQIKQRNSSYEKKSGSDFSQIVIKIVLEKLKLFTCVIECVLEIGNSLSVVSVVVSVLLDVIYQSIYFEIFIINFILFSHSSLVLSHSNNSMTTEKVATKV